MDCIKMGNFIKKLRNDKEITQKHLANFLGVSEQAVSKWERGLSCPDISLLTQLSEIFTVNINDILKGELSQNDSVNGNMKNSLFYVCPVCGNISICTGKAEVSCCGKKLSPLKAKKAEENEKLKIEVIENERFLTSSHPMEKKNFISFIAFLTSERIELIKTYPEWDLQVRLSTLRHGTLLYFSTENGLLFQYC